MATSHTPSANHRRKISFADLERTFRASKGPMVPPPQAGPNPTAPSPAQLQAAHLAEIRRGENARRLCRKPTDRTIPDELSSVIVGDGVERYAQLRDVERKLDATMMRKRLDVSDNLQRRYTRREGVLRLWISNTAEGQPWQMLEEGKMDGGEDEIFDFERENGQATFRVKIEGRLLDDMEDEESKDTDEKTPQTSAAPRPRLSQFFKSITIDFQRNPALQPDGYSAIEWRKPQPTAQNPTLDPGSSEVAFDTLEFERKADESINVIISLVRDEKNERFKLSPALAELLDVEEEDRAGAVQGVWEYCRAMGLQEDEDKRAIVCDDALKKVCHRFITTRPCTDTLTSPKLFGKDSLYFPYVPDLLHPHLQPLPPVQLHYTIRVDKSYILGSATTAPPTQPSAPTIYDLRLPLPNPLLPTLTRFHTSKTHLPLLHSIVQTDDDLALLVQQLHRTNAKRKFYDSLARDPARFVKRWVSSQQRDLEVITAEATRGGGEDGQGEEWRRGGEDGVWGGEIAKESVGLWLARQGAPKAH